MSKKKIILLIVGVVVIGGLAAVTLLSDNTQITDIKSAKVTERDLVEEVSASGRIQPQTKVDICSQVTGEIIALPVREGDHVSSGQLLVVLDTTQLRSDVDRARYSVTEFNARLEGARSRLEETLEEFERQKKMLASKTTSEMAYSASRYAYLAAKSQHDAMVAQSKQFQAAYDKQLDNLRRAKIVAPMPGIVTYVDCEVGEIAPAQNAFTQGKTLMTISNLDVFEVEVEVDETEIAKIVVGQETSIEVDALPDTTFAGEVVEIGNTALSAGSGTQDQSTTFRVKIIFKESDVNIRPGMSSTVDITTARRDNALSVPFSAIIMRTLDLDSLETARMEESAQSQDAFEVHAAETTEGDDTVSSEEKEPEREELKGVFVLRDGKARFVPVETGIADQQFIEVVSGLELTDSVVSGPYRTLRTVNDGDDVKSDEGKDEGEDN